MQASLEDASTERCKQVEADLWSENAQVSAVQVPEAGHLGAHLPQVQGAVAA